MLRNVCKNYLNIIGVAKCNSTFPSQRAIDRISKMKNKSALFNDFPTKSHLFVVHCELGSFKRKIDRPRAAFDNLNL